MTDDLHVDPTRLEQGADLTGFYCRAIGTEDRWGTYDIGQLDRPSLTAFLVSRGPVSDWALHVVYGLLGHSPYQASSNQDTKEGGSQ